MTKRTVRFNNVKTEIQGEIVMQVGKCILSRSAERYAGAPGGFTSYWHMYSPKTGYHLVIGDWAERVMKHWAGFVEAQNTAQIPPKLNLPPQSDETKKAAKAMLVYDGTAKQDRIETIKGALAAYTHEEFERQAAIWGWTAVEIAEAKGSKQAGIINNCPFCEGTGKDCRGLTCKACKGHVGFTATADDYVKLAEQNNPLK